MLFGCAQTEVLHLILRNREIEKPDGDMTQNYFVFVCFQGCTVSFIVDCSSSPASGKRDYTQVSIFLITE